MEDHTKKTLESLAGELIEGQLTAERREQVNFMLRDSESCRSLFNSLMDVQAGMTQLAGQSQEPLLDSSRVSSGSNQAAISEIADRRRVNGGEKPWRLAGEKCSALPVGIPRGSVAGSSLRGVCSLL